MSLSEHAADQTSAINPPRWPRLVVVCALLPLGILGALALSAAATVDLAERHGVPTNVQPAAVAMLEVVSTAGTLLAIFAATSRLRGRAMIAVAAASAVSLVAGVSAYGWFGGVAPVALVGLVHLAAEAYQELRPERPATEVEAVAPTVPAVPVVPAAAPAPKPVGPMPTKPDQSTAEWPIEPPEPKRGAVYRLWSASGELLYIGMSQPGPWLHDRLVAHRASPWGQEIDHETVIEFQTRDIARTAEAVAIRNERPKYNVQHNGSVLRERALGPVHGPKTLVQVAREIVDREPDIGDRRLAEALEVTRHRARTLLRELRSGLTVVSAS